MSNISDTNLIAFKAISNFVIELGTEFAKKQRSLALYKRLVEKTTLVHEQPILKHISAFRKFCIDNREALEHRDETKLVNKKIVYSERVFIGIDTILKMADNDTKSVIWDHLLTITAIVDPTSKAKQLLQQASISSDSKGPEQDFLMNIFEKVEQHVDPNSTNPMQAISGILNSGVFTELISSMSENVDSGQLDLGRLMGTVQSLVGSLGSMAGGSNDDAQQMMGQLMGSLGGASQFPTTKETKKEE